MTIALSHKEQEMLAAVIKEMGELPAVDYAKVALVTGQKYPKNARSAFKRIWDKLRGGPVAASGAKGGTKPARKPPVRAVSKKPVGLKKAPRKASTRGRAARRKLKKEDSVETDESIKADPDEGSDDEVVIKSEKYDEGGSGQEDDEASIDEDCHSNTKDVTEMVGDDEVGAYMLGVPLEEYRALAKETDHGEECRKFKEEVDHEYYAAYAPTPPGPTFSDDDDAA